MNNQSNRQEPMAKLKGSIGLLGLILAATLLSACVGQSPPSRFYALQPLITQPLGRLAETDRLGVGPIRMADYLDRQQVVRRSADGQLDISEFHRWGGNLEQNIMDVLALNLSKALALDTVVTYPWKRSLEIHYQLALDVRYFDMDSAGKVTLAAQWRLLDDKTGKLLHLRNEQIEVQAEGTDYAQQTQAQSQALAQLAQHVAEALLRL